MPSFQLIGHLRVLAEHDIAYVIVGGVGGRFQGTPVTTGDLDIVPDLHPENLDRLARAISGPGTQTKPANSTIYVEHPEIDPAEFWTTGMTQYQTVHGGIDVLIELPGVGPYDVVAREARRYDLRGYDLAVQVASLDHIIRSKETAGRAKDWRALDSYYEARARLAERGDDYELNADALDVTQPPSDERP